MHCTKSYIFAIGILSYLLMTHLFLYRWILAWGYSGSVVLVELDVGLSARSRRLLVVPFRYTGIEQGLPYGRNILLLSLWNEVIILRNNVLTLCRESSMSS